MYAQSVHVISHSGDLQVSQCRLDSQAGISLNKGYTHTNKRAHTHTHTMDAKRLQAKRPAPLGSAFLGVPICMQYAQAFGNDCRWTPCGELGARQSATEQLRRWTRSNTEWPFPSFPVNGRFLLLPGVAHNACTTPGKKIWPFRAFSAVTAYRVKHALLLAMGRLVVESIVKYLY